MNALMRLLGRLERWAKGPQPEPHYEPTKSGAEYVSADPIERADPDDIEPAHVQPADYERPLPANGKTRSIKKPKRKRKGET